MTYRIAVIQFPGSNCERETILAIKRARMIPRPFLWNGSESLISECDGYVIVGGFSYEDRLRSGFIASLDPIMTMLKTQSLLGKPILGICNGAQILVESGLVPGFSGFPLMMALTENERLDEKGKLLGTGYYNDWIHLKASGQSAFTLGLKEGFILKVPIAHAEGRFVFSKDLLKYLKAETVATFSYCTAEGAIENRFPINPNGTIANLAAIANRRGNVMAMMPHPERTTAGDPIFQSMRQYLETYKPEKISPLPSPLPKLDLTPAPLESTHSFHFIIDSIVTDNVAISLKHALARRYPGLQFPLKRYRYLCIQHQANTQKEIEILQKKLIESESLFNPNKEHLVQLAQLPTETQAHFLVQAKTNLSGRHLTEDLLSSEDFSLLEEISENSLWFLIDGSPTAEMLLKTEAILANPESHYLSFNPFNQSLRQKIRDALPNCLGDIKSDTFSQFYHGKVRSLQQSKNNTSIIMTSDRLSAFDRNLMQVPFKGEILNRLSAWWFEKTRHIVPNHFIDLLDARRMRVKTCKVFPLEFVMRAYITGSTNTSVWTRYQAGERDINSFSLPEGLVKNQKLPEPILTITTKSVEHDLPISKQAILENQILSAAQYHLIEQYSKKIFLFGQHCAAEKGFMLVDTKYEFGLDAENQICLVDELHTPDSSRYWLSADYEKAFPLELSPIAFDKEKIRLWYKARCNPYGEGPLPTPPTDLIVDMAQQYLTLYRQLTGNELHVDLL